MHRCVGISQHVITRKLHKSVRVKVRVRARVRARVSPWLPLRFFTNINIGDFIYNRGYQTP